MNPKSKLLNSDLKDRVALIRPVLEKAHELLLNSQTSLTVLTKLIDAYGIGDLKLNESTEELIGVAYLLAHITRDIETARDAVDEGKCRLPICETDEE